jgi:very-short-patch-repair endonuclease
VPLAPGAPGHLHAPVVLTEALDRSRNGHWLNARDSAKAAADIAEPQHGVVSRRQLVAARVPRWFVRRERLAKRWRRAGRHTLVVHHGPLSPDAKRWVAVLETSPRAALDGVTALQQAGAKGLTDTTIHVVVPRGARPRRQPGVRVRESRLFREQDVLSVGIRRMRPPVAAATAARWARSDREAQLFLLVCVQQRLAPVEDVREAVERLPRSRRRSMLLRLIVDVAGGVQSLGELDVASDLRRRGLPEPERQVLRRRPSGSEYLDCDFPTYAVVLEIDGAGHAAPSQRLADLLRDLTEIAGGRAVIRLPLEIYRLDQEAVLDRLEDVFGARGWIRPASAA